ncbi:MAG: hypothetical protein K6F00_08420 [Lachnospiraceae bacterium]|nr:hypothetical protein [Lachnospiraceae bacterium]
MLKRIGEIKFCSCLELEEEEYFHECENIDKILNLLSDSGYTIISECAKNEQKYIIAESEDAE